MRKVLFLFILFSTNYFAIAQNDSFILREPPQNEISFKFSLGKQSQIQYQVEQGGNPFLPTKNHGWEINANYALRVERLWKISAGFTFGAGSFDAIYEITNEKFPGINQYIKEDLSSGYYGIPDQWYSDYFITIPFNIHYNLFQFGSKHRIWVNTGVEFQYLFPMLDMRSYSIGYDTATHFQLIDFIYMKNYDHKFKLRFNIGLEYRFQLPYYHELSVGINYAFHTSDMYSGTYEIFHFDPNNTGHGTFSNRMDLLSMNVGYSINSKKKRYKKYQKYKYNISNDLILPPDTMSNIHEVRFGTNPGLYAWNRIEVPNIAATMNPKVEKYQFTSFTFHYLKYLKTDMAWYTGLDADFGGYFLKFQFDKKDYPYLSESYSNEHELLSNYLNLPFGLHRNFRLGNKSKFEVSMALTLSISISGSGSYKYFSPSADSTIMVFKADVENINFITPGGQLNIGYSYETKRKNKWIIGIRGTMNFIKSYTMHYEILNPDKSYYSGEIDMQPFNLQLYWRYALTGKRKRYLRAVGY